MMLTSTLNLLLVASLCTLPPPSRGHSAEDFTTLLKDKVTIDSRARPVKDSATTTMVNVSFHLMALLQLDTVEQKLISTGWLEVMWASEYLTWDPAQYGGASSVVPDPTKVWRPRLTVQNTMTDLKPLGEDYVALFSLYDGTTIWYPADKFETFCRVDVTYFPFDSQTCDWTLFVWGGDPATSVDLNPIMETINLENFVANGEWELLASRAWRTEMISSGMTFPNLKYEITIRRRPSLLALTVLLPVVVLALVNVFVFTIPSEAGERLAYSMTSLLSFGVFMSFILDSMPSSSDTLSIVAVHLSSLLVLSALHVLLCIVSLRLFHRDPDKHPVPPSLQALVVCLEIMLCLDPPAHSRNNKVSAMNGNLMSSSDVDDMNGGGKGGGNGLKGRLDKWAASRKQNQEAYSDPKEMTWQRVSRSLDKLLFRFLFCLVLVTNIVVWTIMVAKYHSYE